MSCVGRGLFCNWRVDLVCITECVFVVWWLERGREGEECTLLQRACARPTDVLYDMY